MNEFRQNLLREFIGPLDDLRARISGEYSREIRHQALRLVHSVKGCSRTFGLRQSARLAAGIEQALAEEGSGEAAQHELIERLALLIESLKHPDFSLTEPPRVRNPVSAARSMICPCGLSATLFEQLTESEKSALAAAIDSEGDVYAIRRAIDPATFADDLRRARTELEASGEVIAVVPDAEAEDPLSRFVVIVANDPGSPEPAQNGERISVAAKTNDQFRQLIEGVADHVSRVAADARKAVGLTVFADERAVRPDRAGPIFEMLMHLASNSVDHGIERSGKIEISILLDRDSVVITVGDNGRGIAIGDDSAEGDAAIGRIFEPGFSAGEGENSGRGYGLFIVGAGVAKLNGKISMKTRKDFGTRFEIRLPA